MPKSKYANYCGPPFASGLVHPGTAGIMVLKDAWTRICTEADPEILRGPLIFDMQGLPTENATQARLGFKTKDPLEWILECDKTAEDNSQLMIRDFKKLGVPRCEILKTNQLDYKLKVMQNIKELWAKGLVYKDVKHFGYCKVCESILANAQIEIKKNRKGAKIFILKWEVLMPNSFKSSLELEDKPVYISIATTQPETMVNNVGVAICDKDYYIYDCGDFYLISGSKELLTKKIYPSLKELKSKISSKLLESFMVNLESKLIPLFVSKKVIFSELGTPESNILTATAAVQLSPSNSSRDLQLYQEYDSTQNQQKYKDSWEKTKNSYLKEVKEESWKNYLFHKVEDLREGEACWRCQTPPVQILQEAWLLKLKHVREKMVSYFDQLEAKGLVIGKTEMGLKTRNWWSKDVDWVLSRSRSYLTPLPLGYCKNQECNKSGQVVPITLNLEDFESKYECYHPQLYKAMSRNSQNYCKECSTLFENYPLGLDVWVDSAMVPSYLPGGCELVVQGTDQFRGWFYGITAMYFVLGQDLEGLKRPYERLAYTGWALNRDRKKLSKRDLPPQQGQETPMSILCEKYGTNVIRSSLVSNLGPKDYVFSENLLAQEAKYQNLFKNLKVFLDRSPVKDKTEFELESELGTSGKWAQEWFKNKLILEAQKQEVLRTANLRNYWTFLKDYSLQKLSRGYINQNKKALVNFNKDKKNLSVQKNEELGSNQDLKLWAFVTLLGNYVLKLVKPVFLEA